MSWWLDSILGKSQASRDAALEKLPAEILALMKEKGLSGDVQTAEEAKLPPELMEMVRDHFNVDGDALPMSEEEAKEHRLALMKERGAYVKTSESWWQRHSYSFCEH
jgi:hypothetical protein